MKWPAHVAATTIFVVATAASAHGMPDSQLIREELAQAKRGEGLSCKHCDSISGAKNVNRNRGQQVPPHSRNGPN